MTPHRDRLVAGDYEPGATAPGQPDLDDMTKAELVAHADQLGIAIDPSATKAEIRAAIDAGS
jgi:hypothetical protein